MRSAQSAECGLATLLCDRHLAFAAVDRAVTIEMRCRSRGWASARSRGIRAGLVQAVFRDRAPTTLAPGPSTRCCSKGATLYRQQEGVGSNLVAPPPQVPTAREAWDPVPTAPPVRRISLPYAAFRSGSRSLYGRHRSRAKTCESRSASGSTSSASSQNFAPLRRFSLPYNFKLPVRPIPRSHLAMFVFCS